MTRKNIINKLLLIFALLILLEPAMISGTLPGVDLAFYILKIITSIIVVFVAVITNMKINSLIAAWAGFQAYMLLITFLNGLEIKQWFLQCAYSSILLILMNISIKNNAEILIESLSLVLGVFVIINSAMMLIKPEGWWIDPYQGWSKCYLLGYDNLSSTYNFAALMLAYYNMKIKNRTSSLLFAAIAIANVLFAIISQCATYIISVGIMLLVLFFKKILKINKLSASICMFVAFIVFFLIQFVSIQNSFAWFFELLGKNTTLSNRTVLWSLVWDKFPQKWLFGYGIELPLNMISNFGVWYAVHLHSYYLQILYQGGAVGFLLFFLLLLIASKKFDKDAKLEMSAFAQSCFVALMSIMEVEAYFNINIILSISLFIIYNNDKLLDLAVSNKLKKESNNAENISNNSSLQGRAVSASMPRQRCKPNIQRFRDNNN